MTAGFTVAESGEKDEQRVENTARVKRHFQCLRRGGSVGRDLAWRPRKRHRVLAVKWLAYADNQHRVSHSGGGLGALKPDWAAEPWADTRWASWPTSVFAADQGGDGASGIFAARYKSGLQLHSMELWDWSHGVKNDILRTFKSIRSSASCCSFWCA